MQVRTPIQEIDPRVEAVYQAIKGHINWNNLVPTCLEAAKEIEKFNDMKGAEKLETLQKALRLALKESDVLDALRKEEIFHTIESVVPIVMQAAVLASKSPILAQVHATCVTCWKNV